MSNLAQRFIHRILGSQLTERKGNEWLWDTFGARGTDSGITVNEHTALTSSAYFACIRLISQTVAQLPAPAYRAVGSGGREKLENHRLYRMWNEEFNPEMTAFVGRETMAAHVVSWGNCYAEIQRNGAMQPVALWPITPDRVRVERAGNVGLGVKSTGLPDRRIVYIVKEAKDREVVLEAPDVFHVPGLGFNGLVGYSVLRMARESLGLSLAARRFGAEFFGQGAHGRGILETDQTFRDEEQIRRLQTKWHETYGPGSDRNGTIVLEAGMKYKPLAVPPEDSQFLETRKFEVTEAARWHLIPPSMIGDLEHATFSNIEHQAIHFVQHGILPWLARFEQEIMRKLRTRQDKNSQIWVEHIVEGLLRGDSESRSKLYHSAFQNGWMSPNEIREKENLNPVDGLDVHLLPENMRPHDEPYGSRSNTATAPEEDDGRMENLLRQGVRRVVNKEADQIIKALNDAKDGDEAKFNAWRTQWVPKHAAYVAEAVQISIEAATAYVESAFSGVGGVLSSPETWKEGRRAELTALAEGIA